MSTLPTTLKTGLVVAGLAVAGAGFTAAPATAASRSAAAGCVNHIGIVTAAGHQGSITATSTRPPTARTGVGPDRIFAPGSVRLASNATEDQFDMENSRISGFAVVGDYLTSYHYTIDENRKLVSPPQFSRVGPGWGQYRYFEVSTRSENGQYARSTAYGLDKDGVLRRWKILAGGRFSQSAIPLTGLGNVKAIALISKTRTYDTFLVTRTTGELQTLRIMLDEWQLKPVVKTVRSKTWQGFEAFQADKCGGGTLLTGIDKDTKTAYQYALSRANGTSTVIESIGKVPATFDAPAFFRWAPLAEDDVLVGE